MAGSGGIFRFFVRVGHRRPVPVALALLAAVGVSLWLATGLEFQTSRFSLVSANDPYQARLLGFFERFGYPDTPVAVVRGGTVEERRALVDAFSEELEKDPAFHHRVLGRVHVEQVAELLFLHRSDALVQLRANLPPDVPLVERVEAGLPGVVQLLAEQLTAGLDGEIGVDPSQSDDALRRLGVLASVLEAQIAGDAPERAVDRLIDEFGGGASSLAGPGLDEAGYLSSRSGEHLIVAIFPELGGTEMADYGPLVAKLHEAVERARATEAGSREGVEVLVTGLPVLNVDEQEVLQTGMRQSTVAVVIGIVVVLLVGFRSFSHTIVALAPIGVGTAIGLGVMYALYGHMNMLTSSFMAVLMGLAIDFSVHLLARRDEALRNGKTSLEALQEASVSAGPGILTGTVTTALAFTTLVISRFTAFAEMGVVTAVSLLVTFVIVMFFVPLALGRGDPNARPGAPKASAAFSGWLALSRRAPIAIIVAALVVTVAGAITFPLVGYNYRYFEFLPKTRDSTRALEILEADGAMSPLFAHVTAKSIGEARAKAEALREQETVLEVQSVTDMLPTLDAARLDLLRRGFAGLDTPDFAAALAKQTTPADLSMRTRDVIDVLDELTFALEQGGRSTKGATAAKEAFVALKTRIDALPPDSRAVDDVEGAMLDVIGRAWVTAAHVAERGDYAAESVPPLFRNRFYSKAGDEIAIYAYPAVDIWNLDEGKRFSDEMESVDPEAAGHGMSMFHHFGWILSDFRRAGLISAGLVLLVLAFDFRNAADVALASLPLVVGFCATGLVLWGFGIDLNPASIVVLPLILGIGIDAGVHIVHRARQSATEHEDGVAVIEDVGAGTGGAVVLAAVTTMVGFAGLLLSEYGAMSSLGITMVIGTGSCVVASVVVLPAVLLVVKRAR